MCIERRHWSVRPRRTAPTVEVTADYVVLEQGHLVFRNLVRGGYPEVVRIFAPGAWIECTHG